MANLLGVQIIQGQQQLLDNLADFRLLQLLPIKQMFKQISPSVIVSDNKQSILPLPNFSDIQNIRVI